MALFTVEKTNKKKVVYHFETFAELREYAEKNRYGQGYVKLIQYHNGMAFEVEIVSNLYNLNGYCTAMVLKKEFSK